MARRGGENPQVIIRVGEANSRSGILEMSVDFPQTTTVVPARIKRTWQVTLTGERSFDIEADNIDFTDASFIKFWGDGENPLCVIARAEILLIHWLVKEVEPASAHQGAPLEGGEHRLTQVAVEALRNMAHASPGEMSGDRYERRLCSTIAAAIEKAVLKNG